jgi:hypothetical protein
MRRPTQLQLFQAAIKALEPAVQKAFLAAVADIRSTAQLAVIVRALQEGRTEDAVRAVSVNNAFWAPLDDAMRGAYLQGGRDAVAALPVVPDPVGPGKSSSALRAGPPERKNGWPKKPQA